MENKEMKKKIETDDGVWVLGKNTLLEKILGDKISDEQKYNPYKLLTNGEYFIIYSISETIPNISAYNKENVKFKEEDSKVTVEISGEVEFSDFYDGEEKEEEFLENFLQDWGLTKEEIEKYSKTYEQEKLKEINISIIGKSNEDERRTSNEVLKNPIMKKMEREEGIWFREKNLIAKAIFQDKVDEKFPERAVNLKKSGEEIILKVLDDEIITRKYYLHDIVFEIKNTTVTIIRKEKHFDETVEKLNSSKEITNIENLPILFIR
jgi:hypothetical protein